MAEKKLKKVPEILPETSQLDAMGAEEAAAFDSGELEKRAAQNEAWRSESIKNTLHYVALIVLGVFVLFFVAFLVSWGYHLVTPESWHYLTSEQVDKLQSFVLSSVVAASLSKYFESYMK